MNVYTNQDERQLTADYGKYLTLSAEGIEPKNLPLAKIVHLPLSENVGEWKEIAEDEAQRIRQAKKAASGEAEMQMEQFAQQMEQFAQQMKLATMTINTMSLTDAQALEVKDLYPQWKDLVGQTLPKGFRLLCDGNLYKVLQEHTAQEDWKPGTSTASLYALTGTDVPEEGEHAGTKEDPIPYEQMMLIEKDKYYTQDGILYIGLMDAPKGYPNDLKDLPTLAQVVNEE